MKPTRFADLLAGKKPSQKFIELDKREDVALFVAGSATPGDSSFEGCWIFAGSQRYPWLEEWLQRLEAISGPKGAPYRKAMNQLRSLVNGAKGDVSSRSFGSLSRDAIESRRSTLKTLHIQEDADWELDDPILIKAQFLVVPL